ncbi:hypothetical protein ACFO5R_11325 [Halosolutus amylolyticus]|uniref:DUF7573 domain-containing protein n=1 Tax=Halosolutus amylolyticus TaxID=2932267 RepID=A0ABD5PPY6_9EURY|nr:hypothetical protein [Halosolutus amylolyticus]
MTDDATLSEFAPSRAKEETDDPESDVDETDSASNGDETGDRVRDTDASGDATADRAGTPLSTYAWGEYTCARCDRAADRVWREDGAFVCPECKDW